MFRGIHAINMDSKGRMAIPARYRDALQSQCEGRLVATIDTEERCLLLYPQPQWEDIQAKIEALPSFNPAARRVQRLLIGHACDVEMDGNGRILVPPTLRDYAGLEKKLMVVGQGKKLELWSEDHWNERRDRWLEEANGEAAIPEEMQSLSL